MAGRLYIAWCGAAIGLPVLAGTLFDRTGSYASTVWVAAGINVLGMLVAGRLPARGDSLASALGSHERGCKECT